MIWCICWKLLKNWSSYFVVHSLQESLHDSSSTMSLKDMTMPATNVIKVTPPVKLVKDIPVIHATKEPILKRLINVKIIQPGINVLSIKIKVLLFFLLCCYMITTVSFAPKSIYADQPFIQILLGKIVWLWYHTGFLAILTLKKNSLCPIKHSQIILLLLRDITEQLVFC